MVASASYTPLDATGLLDPSVGVASASTVILLLASILIPSPGVNVPCFVARASYIPLLFTGLLLPSVGSSSNVRLSCFVANAAYAPPLVTGFGLSSVGVLSASTLITPPEMVIPVPGSNPSPFAVMPVSTHSPASASQHIQWVVTSSIYG